MATWVAVIGLGSMGSAAAPSPLKAGLAVTGVAPCAEARAAFVAASGMAVASAGDIAENTEAAMALVVDDREPEAALFGAAGAAERLAPGAVISASTTMPPASARSLVAEAERRGFLSLDARV